MKMNDHCLYDVLFFSVTRNILLVGIYVVLCPISRIRRALSFSCLFSESYFEMKNWLFI